MDTTLKCSGRSQNHEIMGSPLFFYIKIPCPDKNQIFMLNIPKGIKNPSNRLATTMSDSNTKECHPGSITNNYDKYRNFMLLDNGMRLPTLQEYFFGGYHK